MTALEPSRHWQSQKHQQILNQESPTAFAQLSELALPHLVNFLRREFRQVEAQQLETAAIDALLSYHTAPGKYNPDKLSLFGYLRMAARHDLLNALDRSKRQNRPLLDIDEPRIQSELISENGLDGDPASLENWLGISSGQTRQDLLRKFEADLDSTDRQLFILMLNGVRETEPYAEMMQLTDLPLATQRREVKRAKDRLTKKLTRFIHHQES